LDETSDEREIAKSADKDFKQPPTNKFWTYIIIVAFAIYVILLTLQFSEIVANLRHEDVSPAILYGKWICGGLGVGEIVLAIWTWVRGVLGEKDYQIFQGGFQLLLTNLQINDVDSTQVPIKITKADVHPIQLDDTEREFLYATNIFKERMNKEINSLQNIDMNPIEMFRELDPKEVEVENLRLKIRDEYDRICELKKKNQLELLWRGFNSPLYEKIQESNEFSKRFEEWLADRMKQKIEQDKKKAQDKKDTVIAITAEEKISNGNKKKSKKEKEEETDKKNAEPEIEEPKEEKAPEFDEKVIYACTDPNALLKIYNSFHNFRMNVWYQLREFLKKQYRIELANMEDFKTYFINLPQPKILLNKNWADATDKEHEEKGSQAICLTLLGDWDKNFQFPNRLLYDKVANRFVKYDAALCSFQFVTPLHARIPWFIKEGGNQYHKSDYNIAMHISQIRDLKDEILEYLSYNALQNHIQLRDYAIQMKAQFEAIQFKFDDLKGANMEKWIDSGEFPLKIINRSLAPPMNVSHYWMFFFFSIIGVVILMVSLFKGGVFSG
jgi:hypothetical protein